MYIDTSGYDYDAIVVGAGHNSLVTAAYLSQTGHRVAVFERRDLAGGAVSTKEIFEGYQFDLGGSAHILIRLTPIVEELGLENYGLEYIDLDPLFFSPFPDGDALFIYRDADRTADHFENKYPGEGDNYRQFIQDWTPFARSVRDTFLSVPGPLQLGKEMLLGSSTEVPWQQALGMILKPYGEVVDQYFKEEKIKAPLTWMAAQSGPPPSEPMSAPFLLWHPLYHESGVSRPRGGSGMLTQALVRHIESHGGEVFLNAPVEEILTEGSRARGVRAMGHVYTSKVVISGAHILETINRLLPRDKRPSPLRHPRVGNGFGAILRLALSEPIQYDAHPGNDARIAMQLICRDRQQIMDAYADFLKGRPAVDPPLVAMSFSAVDDSLAPPGGEVLWLWGQYYPYELTGNESWDEIGDDVADSILDTFEQYAPGTKSKVVGQLFQHPLWLERELGLFRGNVMHIEMSIDQMFMMRPFADMSNYRTHIDGLYLTGASTHPGGGIMGASGRNTARVVMQDDYL
jgi:phytoene dehydrogenase-like protein